VGDTRTYRSPFDLSLRSVSSRAGITSCKCGSRFVRPAMNHARGRASSISLTSPCCSLHSGGSSKATTCRTSICGRSNRLKRGQLRAIRRLWHCWSPQCGMRGREHLFLLVKCCGRFEDCLDRKCEVAGVAMKPLLDFIRLHLGETRSNYPPPPICCCCFTQDLHNASGHTGGKGLTGPKLRPDVQGSGGQRP
jgi:hypothetical protein